MSQFSFKNENLRLVSATDHNLVTEFSGMLAATSGICDKLVGKHGTWPFEESEQSVVGTFCAGAALAEITPYVESTYHDVHDTNHRCRIDLWLDMSLSTYLEFKLAVDGRDSDNLKTRLKCAEKQLSKIKCYSGGTALAVVAYAYDVDGERAKQKVRDFAPHCGDMIVEFSQGTKRRATVFFKRVW